MKYLVQVNRKFLVSIEAESALSAEHALLDMDGVMYACAFDPDMTKTDTFHGVLLDCSTISIDELKTMSDIYACKWSQAGAAQDAADEAAAIERDLHDQLEKAIARRKETSANALHALKAAREWQTTVMGLLPEDVR